MVLSLGMEGCRLGYGASTIRAGVALGSNSKGGNYGVAVGYTANGIGTNIAIGASASAGGGVEADSHWSQCEQYH